MHKFSECTEGSVHTHMSVTNPNGARPNPLSHHVLNFTSGVKKNTGKHAVSEFHIACVGMATYFCEPFTSCEKLQCMQRYGVFSSEFPCWQLSFTRDVKLSHCMRNFTWMHAEAWRILKRVSILAPVCRMWCELFAVHVKFHILCEITMTHKHNHMLLQ